MVRRSYSSVTASNSVEVFDAARSEKQQSDAPGKARGARLSQDEGYLSPAILVESGVRAMC